MLFWLLLTLSPNFPLFPHFQILMKNNHWNISSDFQFSNFFIRLNQICPKWIKMDQTWSNLISDEIIIEIYYQIFNFIYFLIRFNQICPKWIKMDQTWSNLIFDEIIIEIYHWSDFQLWLFLDQIKSDPSKMDQTWSYWISDKIIIEIYHQLFNFIYFLIRLDQIHPK